MKALIKFLKKQYKEFIAYVEFYGNLKAEEGDL